MPLEEVAHDDAQPVRRYADRVRVRVRRAPVLWPHVAVGTHRIPGERRGRGEWVEPNDLRAGDVPELRERVDERERDGTLGWWAGDRVADPSEEDDESSIGLCHQEAAKTSQYSNSSDKWRRIHTERYSVRRGSSSR